MPMKCLRKFVSLVAIGAIGSVPVLGVGCNDQSGGAASTGQAVSTTPKTDGAPAPAPAPAKIKKEKKKKPATTAAESGSTFGGGVNPPVK